MGTRKRILKRIPLIFKKKSTLRKTLIIKPSKKRDFKFYFELYRFNVSPFGTWFFITL